MWSGTSPCWSPSSGVALAAASRVAAGLGEDAVVVVLLPDSGRTYLSTYFDDDWLTAQGFTDAGPGSVGTRSSVSPETDFCSAARARSRP